MIWLILTLALVTLSILKYSKETDRQHGNSVNVGAGVRSRGTIAGYSQVWLRGEGPTAHVHEGIRMADGSGWVAIGNTLPEEKEAEKFQVSFLLNLNLSYLLKEKICIIQFANRHSF